MSTNARHGGNPPFSVSQNFLTGTRIIHRLLRLTSICKNDHVIEIGAGKGHITKELVKVCRFVSAFEVDGRLFDRLQVSMKDVNNLSLKRHDFLKAALPESGTYKVFSNIPFSITSDIMRKLTTAANPPAEAWLVMEKGAAKRFLGKPNDTHASILVKPFFNVQIDYYFSKQDFHPAPSVDAVLLHLTRKPQPDIPVAQRKSYCDFVARGTRYGINSLLTKRQISTALRRAGLPGIKESGLTLYVQWLCLFRCYRQFHGG